MTLPLPFGDLPLPNYPSGRISSHFGGDPEFRRFVRQALADITNPAKLYYTHEGLMKTLGREVYAAFYDQNKGKWWKHLAFTVWEKLGDIDRPTPVNERFIAPFAIGDDGLPLTDENHLPVSVEEDIRSSLDRAALYLAGNGQGTRMVGMCRISYAGGELAKAKALNGLQRTAGNGASVQGRLVGMEDSGLIPQAGRMRITRSSGEPV